MAWAKLGSTTLASANNAITTDVITSPKKFNFILCHGFPNALYMDIHIRVGNTTIDTGNNYAKREADDAEPDGIGTSLNYMAFGRGTGAGHDVFSVAYFINITTQEKLFMAFGISNGGNGAGNAPNRRVSVGKWANTSSQIDIIAPINSTNSSNQFASDSNVMIMGTD